MSQNMNSQISWVLVATKTGQLVDLAPFFQDIVLRILPDCLLLLSIVVREITSYKNRGQTVHHRVSIYRAVLLILLALEISGTLALYSFLPQDSRMRSTASTPAQSLRLLAILAILYHYVSRPLRSYLLEIYFLAFAVLEGVRVHSLWSTALNTDFATIEVGVSALETSTLLTAVGLLVIQSHRSVSCPKPNGQDNTVQRENIEEHESSVVGLILMTWLRPVLVLGKRKALSQETLKHLFIHPAALFLSFQDLHDLSRNSRKSTAGLLLAGGFAQATLPRFLGALALQLALTAVTLCQPWIIRAFVVFLESTEDISVGAWLVVAIFFDFSLAALFAAQTGHMMDQVCSQARGYLIFHIQQRSLSAAVANGAGDAARPMVLVGSDVIHVATGLKLFNDLIANAITVAAGAYFLSTTIGVAFIAPLLIAAVTVGVPFVLGPRMARSQRRFLEAAEDRMQITSELLSHATSARMADLQDLLVGQVTSRRRAEVDAMTVFRRANIAIIASADSVNGICTLAAIGFYCLGGSEINYTVVFTSLSILSIMIGPLVNFVQMLPALHQGIVSWKRIVEYICPRRGPEDANVLPAGEKPEAIEAVPGKSSLLVDLENASFSGEKDHPVLHNISFAMTRGDILVVVGKAGSGKSALTQAVLGELHLDQGRCSMKASRVGLCTQTPWFMPDMSIRDNIIFGCPCSEDMYMTVLQCCCLEEDIRGHELDPEAIMDSKGSSLSGGQRKRVALARALYREPDLLILDDPFAGIDQRTSQDMCSRIFGPLGFIKTRQNPPAVLMACTNVPWRFADITHKVVRLANGRKLLEDESRELEEPEVSENMTELTESVRFQEETLASSEGAEETRKPRYCSGDGTMSTEDYGGDQVTQPGKYLTGYGMYLRSLGYVSILLLCCFVVIKSGLDKGSPLWLSYWAQQYSLNSPAHTLGYYNGVYAALVGAGLFALLGACCLLLMVMIPRSSMSLHHRVLARCIRIPVSILEPRSSEIINRFAQDMTLIDLQLPLSILNTVFAFAAVLGDTVIFALASVYILASLAVFVPILVLVQRKYIAASRPLRTLQIETQAPVLAAVAAVATRDGGTTMRAHDLSIASRNALAQLVTHSLKAPYLLRSLQLWLQLVVGLINAGTATLLASLLVGLRGTLGDSLARGGVALINTIGLGQDLKLLLHWFTTMEVNLGVLRRISEFLEYSSREEEGRLVQEPPTGWPLQGSVTLEAVSVMQGTHSILSNLNICIKPGEKVAILGRTGSGKSSLVGLFFGLTSKTHGRILVDEVDIDGVAIKELRRRFAGLPQHNFSIGTSTLREGLDPGGSFSDEIILGMLHKLSIASAVALLDTPWDECGFSVGQQQQMAFARTMLRTSTLYVLDEPSSSLDDTSHEVIVEYVCRQMLGKTVLFVTHRLEGLHNFDSVICLAEGKVVEYGNPRDLIRQSGGYLSTLTKYTQADK